MNRTVPAMLQRAIKRNRSLVCCGLDPDIRKMPLSSLSSNVNPEESIYDFLKSVIDLTSNHVCSYKIQKAFFDLYPDGKRLLKNVVAYVKRREVDLPVIIDCKIGDIDNTMDAYLQNLFQDVKADAVILNPYMGPDVWKPMSKYPDKAGLVLVRTSNPGSTLIQEAKLHNETPLWRFILEFVITEWRAGMTLFPVLSSNSTHELKDIRKTIPNDMPILLAGVGAQGGDIDCLKYLVDDSGSGVMVNSSRGILFPYSAEDSNWREAVERAVVNMKNSINAAIQ